jgi:hypothetical protein
MKQLLLALAIPLFAANNDWAALVRISPAQKTMIQALDGKRHTGAFVSYTDDAVVIQTRKGQQTFEKPRVKLITARITPRARSARNGALIVGALAVPSASQLEGSGRVGVVCFAAGLGALIGLNQNTVTIIYRKK